MQVRNKFFIFLSKLGHDREKNNIMILCVYTTYDRLTEPLFTSASRTIEPLVVKGHSSDFLAHCNWACEKEERVPSIPAHFSVRVLTLLQLI
jgi:hypothetical protein